MDVISTTNPIPPQGTTSTQVPFGLSASTAESNLPSDIKIVSTGIFNMSKGLYIGSFPINATNLAGTSVFNWSSRSPLFVNVVADSDLYALTTLAHPMIPWDLITAYFARMGKVEYTLLFVPSKITDCRVNLDFIFNYGGAIPSYTTQALANNSVHMVLDDPDEKRMLDVPQFWPTSNVSIDTIIVDELGTNYRLPNANVPDTTITGYIRTPYHYNGMQMPSFNVLVYIFPKPNSLQSLAARNYNSNALVDAASYRPIPYFLPV